MKTAKEIHLVRMRGDPVTITRPVMCCTKMLLPGDYYLVDRGCEIKLLGEHFPTGGRVIYFFSRGSLDQLLSVLSKR